MHSSTDRTQTQSTSTHSHSTARCPGSCPSRTLAPGSPRAAREQRQCHKQPAPHAIITCSSYLAGRAGAAEGADEYVAAAIRLYPVAGPDDVPGCTGREAEQVEARVGRVKSCSRRRRHAVAAHAEPHHARPALMVTIGSNAHLRTNQKLLHSHRPSWNALRMGGWRTDMLPAAVRE